MTSNVLCGLKPVTAVCLLTCDLHLQQLHTHTHPSHTQRLLLKPHQNQHTTPTTTLLSPLPFCRWVHITNIYFCSLNMYYTYLLICNMYVLLSVHSYKHKLTLLNVFLCYRLLIFICHNFRWIHIFVKALYMSGFNAYTGLYVLKTRFKYSLHATT